LRSTATQASFLLSGVVGSGIMAARLSGGNGALALLCNTLPTGAILTVLILTFGPISGAHFNPAVSIALALRRELPTRIAVIYIGAQVIGAILDFICQSGSDHCALAIQHLRWHRSYRRRRLHRRAVSRDGCSGRSWPLVLARMNVRSGSFSTEAADFAARPTSASPPASDIASSCFAASDRVSSKPGTC
jgi:hypothetical protein